MSGTFTEKQKLDFEQRAVVIDAVHDIVHDGRMFHAEHVATSVNNAASLDFLFNTGQHDQHMIFSITAGGACRVYIYESPTVSGGTAVALYNMNRDSTGTTEATLKHTPTVTATGSVALVPGRYVPGGTSEQTRVGGQIRNNTEWEYKANTDYLIRVTNSSGQAVFIDGAFEWYAGR